MVTFTVSVCISLENKRRGFLGLALMEACSTADRAVLNIERGFQYIERAFEYIERASYHIERASQHIKHGSQYIDHALQPLDAESFISPWGISETRSPIRR